MEQGFEFPRDLERLVHDRLFSARRAAQRLRFRPGVAVSSSSPIDVQRQQRRKKTLARALHCLREDYGTSLEMSQEALAYTNSLEDALCFLALQYTSDELPPKLRAQPVDGHKTVDAATGHLVVEKHEHKARARQFAIAWDDGNMKAIQANETQETTPQHAQALSWTHEYVRAQEEEQETAADDTGHVLAQRGRNGAVKTKTETVACSSGPLDQDTIVETHARKEEADAGDTGELDSDDGVCGLLEEAEATVVSADEMKQRAGLDPAARIAAHAVAALKANKGAKRRTKQRDQVPAAAASTHAAPAWTGPTPRELLAQHCRQQGRAKPQYKKLPRAAASSGHLYSVTIGTKRGSAATFQVTPEADDAMHGFETIGDAKDRVATMALYDVASHLPLYLVLPPVYRAMWLEWLQEREEREANVAQAHADQQEKLVEDIFHALPRELATKKVDVEPPPIGEQRASSTGIEGAPLTDKALLTQCNVDDWDEVSDDDTHRVEESPDEEAVASTEQQDESDVRAALELSRELRAQLQNQMRTRAYHVQLKQRALLPIASWKQRILEMVSTHDVMLISGETGCGKSTQVPHFVLEDVLLSEPGGARGCIVCAQPRRLAATSLAAQVSKELGEQRMGTPESLVGYQIRLEARMTRRTRLLFCTTGILLQKLQDPSTFSKDVSHVIVDEVHERDLQSDVVLALLRQLLAERDAHQQHGGGSLPSFKVILMSATLNAASFQTYFGGDALCPRIDVRGRTFPVDHYYLEDDQLYG
ncbi:hypothetical protein PsorP6_018187 [Peronosclerospora sorghi]|uniref:Uncharacterized protein n=1 Tax=Peronosclerospora sorghi TaxID=230839 RepID=A0ACC0WFK3_9STRA|nr:hypothetical protein PsorP6_018187 [Peronosclerospora sorghi]